MVLPSDPASSAVITPLVVAIDGPAGAGKTTLAANLAANLAASFAASLPGGQACTVVAMDLLYDGWDGLEAGVDQASMILQDLACGRTPTYRRYDWARGQYAETVSVPVAPVVILEGVGSASTRPRADHVVWIEATADVRRLRAQARGDFADQWERWAEREHAHFERTGTRGNADVIITATGADPDDLADQVRRMGWFAPPRGNG